MKLTRRLKKFKKKLDELARMHYFGLINYQHYLNTRSILMSDKLNKYIVTFGSAHLDKYGNSLQHVIAHIEAKDEATAREIIFEHRKSKWAFIYPYSELKKVSHYYHLGYSFVPIEDLNIMEKPTCLNCNQEVEDFCPPKLKFNLPEHNILISSEGDKPFAYCVNCVVNELVKELHEFQNDYIHNHVNEPEINGGDNK